MPECRTFQVHSLREVAKFFLPLLPFPSVPSPVCSISFSVHFIEILLPLRLQGFVGPFHLWFYLDNRDGHYMSMKTYISF
jgi:hypothetical protein